VEVSRPSEGKEGGVSSFLRREEHGKGEEATITIFFGDCEKKMSLLSKSRNVGSRTIERRKKKEQERAQRKLFRKRSKTGKSNAGFLGKGKKAGASLRGKVLVRGANRPGSEEKVF